MITRSDKLYMNKTTNEIFKILFLHQQLLLTNTRMALIIVNNLLLKTRLNKV